VNANQRAPVDGELQNWPKATWSNNVTEGNGRLAFKRDLEFAMDSFGVALQPEDGSFGTFANIFSDRARELVNRRGIVLSVMLGHLMPHELGHLLLGTGAPSFFGIMHVPWHNKELDLLSRGLMAFMPFEAERMRISVQERAAAQRALEAAIVPGS